MSRSIFALCFVLSLSPAVYSDYEGQVTSFEEWWPDPIGGGWAGPEWSAPPSATPGSTIGVTDGLYSLKINAPGGTWWNEAMSFNLTRENDSLYDFFYGWGTFFVDITVLQSEWMMDTAIGWTTSPQVSLLLNPGSGQWWNLGPVQIGQPLNGNITMTASWDYRAYLDQISPDVSYIKMTLAFVNYGYLTPAPYYIDNARFLIPEPATMALLAFGALALLRRKR
jgi:hypothetical protein